MVEIMEYILVFAVTAVLAGFSLLVLQGSLPALKQTQGQSEFNQLSGAAGVAAVAGSSEVVLPVDDASVGCSAGTMSFSSGGTSYSSSAGLPCDFQDSGLSGVCKFLFTADGSALNLQVTC